MSLDAERVRAWCRVCLRNRGVLNIFLSRSALAKLRACAPIQINEDDGLPDSLCTTCANNLDQAYYFRMQCEESDKRLSALRSGARLAPQVELKEEPEFGNAVGQFEQLLIKKEEIDTEYQDEESCADADADAPAAARSIDAQYGADGASVERLTVEVDYVTRETGVYRLQCTANAAEARPAAGCRGRDPAAASVAAREPAPQELACQYCPHKLRNRRELSAHLRRHKQDTYKCEVCRKVCKGARRIEIHKNTHVNTERTCEICGMVLHKYKLKGHIADRHTPNPKECPLCKKVLSCRSSLTNHLQRHVDMELQCDLCGKKYRNKISLRMHIKTHFTKKLFPCSFCEKRFSSDKYKTAHEHLHTGVKFECLLCGKVFAQRSQLASHCRNNHASQGYLNSFDERRPHSQPAAP